MAQMRDAVGHFTQQLCRAQPIRLGGRSPSATRREMHDKNIEGVAMR